METGKENKIIKSESAANEKASTRRGFLKLSLLAGGVALAGAEVTRMLAGPKTSNGEKIKLLSKDGKLVEVDSANVHAVAVDSTAGTNIRQGVPGKKFVRVIDLARCSNERACIEGCQKQHNLLPPIEWIKVKKMQDVEMESPYWFPQMCYHCDNPPCTKVCPVDATFKRSDGLVQTDNSRCIGCKFCMAACPYSARSFNFGRPEQTAYFEKHKDDPGICPTSKPENYGTVSKCDGCPDDMAKGILPACVRKCPNGVIFYGDENEDTVSNGDEIFQLSALLTERAGYRQFDTLGTKPRTYYLPPVKRNFPFQEAKEKHNTQE
ncbi:MAG: 4Fe-4S dicluster domain-containing protein [Bacteroidetes bacterium]|nr:4Fe-4S dicluster domain-containing protein [Bacteroidota bacterium]MBL0066229.1 4Fe-4S dicluster domain-containing protein [Bacteroidota bacterium]